MAIAGFEAKLDAARTRFETVAADLFAGDMSDETYTLITEMYDEPNEDAITLLDAGPVGWMRKWLGDKQFGAYRLYDKKVRAEPYEKSIEIRRTDIVRDRVGVISKRIDRFVESQRGVFNHYAWEKFLSNPVGIDGTNLLSDAHPFGPNGGTWDNKTTDALTYNSYNTAKVVMRSLRNEKGQLMGIRPTHLFVGPALERTALEITGAMRPVVYTTAGAEATSGNANAAVAIPNVYQGDVTVVVVEEFEDGIHDTNWFLMDLSKGVRPLACHRARNLEAISQTAMDDEQRFLRDVFRFSIEAEFGFDGAYPHVVYGNIS